jgi:large subunit ribosomal protein L9
MSIQVLLMADVKDLGAEGDVVNVSEGYARNLLYPKKLAAPVTEGMKKRLAKIQKDREQTRKQALDAARQKVAELQKVSVTIPVKVGKDEKLFGSVTAHDISEALKKQGVAVDKSMIDMANPIKELGVYDVSIKLNPEIKAAIKVWIVEE